MSKIKKQQKLCVTRELRKQLILKQKNERDFPGMINIYAQIIYRAKQCPCRTTYCLTYSHPLKVNSFIRAIKKSLHTVEYGN